ncbi:MAG: TIGR02281 family clan AA aspartic protease [Pseudomonadota bacterium]
MSKQDFSSSAGKWMIGLSWIVILGLLTLFFSKILDKQYNPNQNVNTSILGDGTKEVVLNSSRHGHYIASGEINSHKVVFLVDTGASFVSIPERLANKIGLTKGTPGIAMTANGNVTVYETVLDRISVGDIVLHDVRANINPGMHGEEVLLGMSFLRNLSLTHAQGQLTIRQ